MEHEKHESIQPLGAMALFGDPDAVAERVDDQAKCPLLADAGYCPDNCVACDDEIEHIDRLIAEEKI